jgi:hypothetical protein
MKTRRLLLLLSLAGCKPDLGAPPSLVAMPRVIAVRLDPPEVSPGGTVNAEVVAVGPQGRLVLGAGDVTWALCLAPKPPAENNVVSKACLGGEGLQPAGDGPRVALTVPVTACALHGPDTPPTKPGEPPLRPRDPDVTGGYYQPIEVSLAAGEQAFALERIGCNLPGVSLEIAQDFGKRYHPNTNPELAALTVDGAPLTAVSDPAAPPAPRSVGAGKPVTFEASWTPASREPFPVYDVGRREIADHHEELVVSWFATAGSFERERTGRQETEEALTVSNVWTAPSTPGPITVWIVLRDNRGGLAVAEYRLTAL